AGQVRVGGFAGSAAYIQAGENGCLIRVKLKVVSPCGTYQDGHQSPITINAYTDDLKSYSPQPAQAVFTLICCGGSISLLSNLSGASGDEIHVPVDIADNASAVCDFAFDFVFDPAFFEFRGIKRSAVTQDWTTMSWSQAAPGKISVTASAGSGTCVPSPTSASLLIMRLMVKCVGGTSDTQTPIRIENYGGDIALLCPRSFEVNFLYRACPRLGDVNGDGSLTPGDAQNAFDIYLGRVTPSSCQLTTADADCSGPCNGKEHTQENRCITPGDAQGIFEHFLGRTVLPVCCADHACSQGPGVNQREGDVPLFLTREVYALPSMGSPGERVAIPVLADPPEGIRMFGLEMTYPDELLEYEGIRSSPLTRGFTVFTAEEIWPGLIRIEGESEQPISWARAGSLVVVVFRVREGARGRAPLGLSSLDGDILGAATRSTWFVSHESLLRQERCVFLGEEREEGGVWVFPVEVTQAFGVKAFGLEVTYPSDRMTFLGVRPTHLTEDFVVVDGNEIREGVAHVGGYSMSGIQESSGGALVELVFKVNKRGARIAVTNVMDDLKDFVIIY
ncbi:MAG: cohesin domain-containing protein, partial [Candidatus Aminicenantales bacterium]